ncbi:MAG: hypothetical protein ACP5HS_05215 [Anaerolineae bacterium]
MYRGKKIGFALLLASLLVVAGVLPTSLSAHPAAADAVPRPSLQTYSFAVPEIVMDATIRPDGSAEIVYDITFENYGSPIDIVDVGTPNSDYDTSQMSATLDGAPVRDIRPSTYIDVGVEIHLDGQAIQTGESGTLHLEFVSPDMVYADTTDEELASMQITPTWFESESVRGTGDIEIRVRTLPNLDPETVIYQDEPFTDKFVDDQGRVVAVWRYEDVAPTQVYRVGVSFPREGMTNVINVTFWDLVGRWLGRVLPGVGAVVLGCLPVVIPLFILFSIVRAVVRGIKPNYLPPIAQVEGGGIKRGLTAPESAVLLELPLTKILGLVIFGMLEKGLIRQTDPDPLTVEVVEAFRVLDKPGLDDKESRRQARRRAAQEAGTVIHEYEQSFLDLIEAHPDTPVSKLAVVKPMQELVDGVAAKMKGFDLSDTQDYYRRVIDRAVEQASSIGDIEQREAYLDRYLPWVMMRRDYRPVLTVGGYHYWPSWARTSGPTAAGAGGSRPSGGKSGGGTTTFGDVSASFAGWAENTMGGMAAAILPTTLSKPSVSSGSSGSRSGGGSSCACACAGCACACACAGGGR